MKLKLAGFVVGGVELNERQYLHASTITARKAKATTTNSTATKAKGIKKKILGYVATVLN